MRWSVFIIFILVLTASSLIYYYASQSNDSKVLVDSYSARKEDLYLSQQKIEASLAELQTQIQIESIKQQELDAKMNDLYAKANTTAPNVTKNVTTQVVTVPAPVTKPVSRPRTRAS